MIQRPREARLSLQVTLRIGGELVQRKVTVLYPKKLYPFELKEEITAFIVGIKTMVRVLGEFQKEARPKVQLHRSRKLKR